MTRMKDSGIEWIGRIPEEWEIKPVKYVATYDDDVLTQNELSKDKVVKYVDIGSVSLESGITNYNIVHLADAPSRARRKVKVGDTIVSTVRTYLKAIAYIEDEQDVIVSTGFSVIRPQKIEGKFLTYALQSDSFTEVVNQRAWGVSYPAISANQLVNIPIAFPKSKDEQTKIADFLDKKVAQLDQAKSLLEEQIQKLEDYRQSLIYETVTKGLDKTAPMKDSGVDWIGQVPEGWGVKPLKYLITYDDDVLTQNELSKDMEVRYVDIGSVSLEKGITNYNVVHLSEAPSRARRKVRAGDTIVSTVRTYLKAIAYIEDEENVIVSTGFSVIRPQKIEGRFLTYALKSDSFTEIVNQQAWGVSYPAISTNQLVNISIVFPKSIDEQLQIADFLDKKVNEVNQMIDIKQKQIENINKQRQTLIYDYVTGKRRV